MMISDSFPNTSMVDLLISFIIFAIVAGIILFLLKLGVNSVPMVPGWAKTLIIYVAYAIIAIVALTKYIGPLLKSLLAM